MIVRKAQPSELKAVSDLAIASFMSAVAGGYTSEGVETFRYFASVEGFRKREGKEFQTFVAEKDGVLLGMAQLKMPSHLAMLFVRQSMQRQGIGRRLLKEVATHSKGDYLTVSSSPNAESAYRKFGFYPESGEKVERGIRFIPMRLKLTSLQS
ncbi:MAG: GNAT family N-acetyltransferase [Verrucomicrobiae bacterium]|nr:GNAT family N-acetyltransferase [Verrucomicrobiae bacterium]